MKKSKMMLAIFVLLIIFSSLGCTSDGTTEPQEEIVSSSLQEDDISDTTKEVVDEQVTEEPEILSSNSYISSGYFYIVGEIENKLPHNLEFVKIVATYYDDNNEVLGTSFTYTELDILGPGQKSPFELSNYPDNFIPSSYKVQASYQITSSTPYDGLSINSYRSSVDGGYYKVVGEVENNGDRTVDFVKLVATFYDDSNEVIGTSFTYTDLDTIAPGDTSPFELTTYPQKINPARYDIQVQAS
jgi:hypothetical protein